MWSTFRTFECATNRVQKPGIRRFPEVEKSVGPEELETGFEDTFSRFIHERVGVLSVNAFS